MSLSQSYNILMVLIPPHSQHPVRFMGLVCFVSVSPPAFWELVLELYLVVPFASTGISPYDVEVHTLDRLLHLNAKRREPSGPQNLNVYELCKFKYLDTF